MRTGSSQFFLTGDQVLQNALRAQPNRSAANDLLTLGGDIAIGAAATPNDLNNTQYAAVVLRLPHSIPSGVGKAHPFPTDLLTQQVQITVELFPVNQIWTNNNAGIVSPTQLATAQFQVQQVVLNNAGDALARRVDMSVNAYAFPCEFTQQVQRIALQNTTSNQSVVLTGFRSGEVKAIHCWLTKTTETTLVNPGTAGIYQPFKWYLPTFIQMSYAGDIYARYQNSSSPLWNLINGNKAPVVDNVNMVLATPVTYAPFLSEWVELPFAQTVVDEDSHYILSHGKAITNGIVNLDIALPSVSANNDWQLNVSYIYNATLLMSQGTADYTF